MTGSTSGAGSFACTVKGGGGSGGRRGPKRFISIAMAGLGRFSSDDGKRFSAGSSYGSREGGGGFGGGGTKKIRFRAVLAFFQIFRTLPDSQTAPGAAEAHRFLKKLGPLFGSFFSLRPFGLVKHNGFGTFVFLHFYS